MLAELWPCGPVAARSADGVEALGVLGAVAIGAAGAVQAAGYVLPWRTPGVGRCRCSTFRPAGSVSVAGRGWLVRTAASSGP